MYFFRLSVFVILIGTIFISFSLPVAVKCYFSECTRLTYFNCFFFRLSHTRVTVVTNISVLVLVFIGEFQRCVVEPTLEGFLNAREILNTESLTL
jgi:hypothetical protein